MSDKQELLDRVKERYEAAKNGPNSCFAEQNAIDDYMKGGTAQALKHGAKTQPPVNVDIILVAIEGQSSILNDTPLDLIVTPRQPSNDLDAMIYQQVVNHVLEDNDAEMLRDRVQKFALLNKVGVVKIVVEMEDERPKIRLRSVNPRYVFVDPTATDPDSIGYVIEVVRMSKTELKIKYPSANVENADIVQDDKQILDFNSGEDRETEKMHVYEMWDFTDKKKYPQGRYVLATDQEILKDKPNEYVCGNPYVFFSCYSVPDRVFGRGAFNSLKSLQDEIGLMFRRMSNIVKIASNPTLLVSTLAGLDTGLISNKDGGVIPVEAVDVRGIMEWIYGPGLSQSMLTYADKLQYYFDTVSGFHDVMQGRAQINAGTPSGRSLDELQYAAQTRLRQMMRNVKSAWKQLGQKIIQLSHSVYDEEDMVRISGADVETVKQVLQRNFNELLAKLAEAGATSEGDFKTGLQTFYKEKGLTAIPGQSDMYLKYKATRLGDPTAFQVKVTAGSDIPKNKLDVAAQAQQMMAAGLLDPQTFMEAMDFPLKEKALSRNQVWQQFLQWKAQMEQQAQQQPQGAPQGEIAPEGEAEAGMRQDQPMVEEPMQEEALPEAPGGL